MRTWRSRVAGSGVVVTYFSHTALDVVHAVDGAMSAADNGVSGAIGVWCMDSLGVNMRAAAEAMAANRGHVQVAVDEALRPGGVHHV